MDQYLSVADAAKQLGVKPHVIHHLIRIGRYSPPRLGKRGPHLIPRADLTMIASLRRARGNPQFVRSQ